MTSVTAKITSATFSEYVMSLSDLYNLALRNGFFLPKKSSSAVNEVMLLNVMQEDTGAQSLLT